MTTKTHDLSNYFGMQSGTFVVTQDLEKMKKSISTVLPVGLSESQISSLTARIHNRQSKSYDTIRCTIKEWLKEQTFELPAEIYDLGKLKPNWNKAPSWAKWLAMDEDGQWHWFMSEVEPDLETKKWIKKDRYSSYDKAVKLDFGVEWTKTLEHYPAGRLKIGQTWKLIDGSGTVEITEIDLFKNWIVAKTKNDFKWEGTISYDFLKKFEVVK